MEKFKVEVTRVDTYEIEIDENIINEEWRKAFSEVFWDVKGNRKLAEHLATFQARFGSEHRFIEGFGPVTRNGKMPFSFNDFDKDGAWLPEDQREQPAPSLNIIIISEDDDIETEVSKITTPDPATSAEGQTNEQ